MLVGVVFQQTAITCEIHVHVCSRGSQGERVPEKTNSFCQMLCSIESLINVIPFYIKQLTRKH